jgi:hypothetical protein
LSEELTVLFEVAQRLEALGIPYMLTGSMAANLYAAPRMTRDLDLIVEIAPETLERLMEAFPEGDFYLSPQAAAEAVAHSSCFNLIHLATMIKIDIMVRKSAQYRMLEFSRRQLHDIDGHRIWVVSKEDLILSKLDWARDSLSDRQLSDVRNLLATGCDLDYLQTWAKHLQLTDILTRASA